MSDLTSPRQVILVTSKAEVDVMGKEIEKDSIITVAWHMPVSFDPKLYAIAIGKTRFSAKLIEKGKVFCINFIGPELEKQALFLGTHSGEHMDKFKETGLTREHCDKIDCSMIKEAMGVIECQLANTIDAGDHYIFVGHILHEDIKKTGKRLMQIGNSFNSL